MFLDILERYQDIIVSYDILQFRMVGASYQFVAKLCLNNRTELHVKDYLFLDGTQKYSYHWQDAEGDCIVRWDNAPHHQQVNTFPFHKHLGKQETITESPPMKLNSALDDIRKALKYH